MARKRILDANACKFTLNVVGDNKEILDKLTERYMVKYGPMINKIIGTFCRMPKSIRLVIEKACLAECKRLMTEIEHTEEKSYHRELLEHERDSYVEILKLINGGDYEIQEEKDEESNMIKIKLADGYLLIPSDWIVVNPERAEVCRYAAVLECRNSLKYGVPHFIYFNNFKHACDYTEHMEAEFFSLCRRAWPRFSEIQELSEKNKLVPDPNNNGKFLNVEAHLATPIIGLFHIDEQGERACGEPPYGAMIVRTCSVIDEGNKK